MNKFRPVVVAFSVAIAGLALPSANAALITVSCSGGGSFTVDDVTNTVSAGGTCAGTAVIPSGVTTIAQQAFYSNASLKSVSLPQGLTTIGNQAFRTSGLVSINIPNTVTSIGTLAFSITAPFASVNFEGGGIGSLTIGNYAFQYFKGGCMVLPSNLTNLSPVVFDASSTLQNIYFSGNAPTVSTDTLTAPAGTTVYHKTTASGFTNPWKTLTTQASTFTTPAFTLSNTYETATRSSAITSYSLNQTGGSVGCYSIFPAPANGLTFNYSTGVLSGSPTTYADPVTYTITGANGAGSGSASFTVSVPAPPATPAFTLSNSAETVTAGTAITGYSISSTGGAVATFSILPAARNGLNFNTSTGLLSGTPSVSDTGTAYTITGTNVSGSASATYRVKVDFAPLPPPPVPDPVQVSTIGSVTPNTGISGTPTPVVITGKFIETIKNISFNGKSLPAGSWSQSASSITLTLPSQNAGTYSIQLYNGAAPLLSALSFTYKPTFSLNWTEQKSAADNGWTSVTFGNGTFVAVANTGSSSRVMYSRDGKVWLSGSGVANNLWASVTYGNGRFVAVSGERTGNRVMSSTDGASWSTVKAPDDFFWRKIKFASGVFVGIGTQGGNWSIIYSTDGINWSPAAVKTNSIYPVEKLRGQNPLILTSIGFGNGIFNISITPGRSALGQGLHSLTSRDGINWLWQMGSGLTYPVQYQTYGCGNYFAMTNSGIYYTVKNPDLWSNSASQSQWINSINDALYIGGLFVGVGNGVAAYSSDGEQWKSANLSIKNSWTSITYGNGIFVAVSSDGSGNRVMTAPFNPAPGITNSSETVELGSAIKGYQLSSEGCTNSGFAISPALTDPGLAFDQKTGLVSGTPTQVTSGVTYTISPLDSDGYLSSATYSLVVKSSASNTTSSGNNTGQVIGETSTVKVETPNVITPPVDTATAGSTTGGPKPASTTTKPTTSDSEKGPLESPISLNIYFAMASYKIDASSVMKLQDLAKTIAGLGTRITVSITGYAQPTPGSELTDGALSENRAAAVAKVLRQYGVTTKVIYKGAGRAELNLPTSRYVEIVAVNR